MKAIEMTRDELKELLKHLPEHLKDKLFHMVKPDSGIELLKEFVEKYEDEDMFDHIVAHTLSNLFKKMNNAVREVTKDKKNRGKKGRISTLEMASITIECLKNEAENIKDALEHHETECKKGDDCGAKH
jgi:Mg/Co/Ni transporter MgtE